MNRKEFIQKSALASLVVIAGGGLLASCKTNGVSAPDVNFSVDLSQNSALNSVGGSIKKNNVIIIRTASSMNADSFIALSSICTHAGCSVSFQKTSNALVCPCHGGRFDTKGKVLSGPPPSDLRVYNTSLDGNILSVS